MFAFLAGTECRSEGDRLAVLQEKQGGPLACRAPEATSRNPSARRPTPNRPGGQVERISRSCDVRSAA